MNALKSTTPVVSTTSPSLNEGQAEAAEAFFQFLFDDQNEMIISGGGGVGKTFLMGHLIDVILPRYFETCKLMGMLPEYDSVEMTTTTNKAAEALAEATKRPTGTIHSFLGLRVHEDYSTGESKLTKTDAWQVHQRKIIFIDECSMIDAALDHAIQEGTHLCKVVYVGDHCQLAPIRETLSPIYRRGLPFYELTEPMRNAGQPELMALCNQLRQTVETGVFQPIQIVPGVIDWFDDATMQQELVATFQNQTKDARILAYTNRRVVEYNDFVRNIRHLPPEFTVGEYLINNSVIQLQRRQLSVEEEVSILRQARHTESVEISENVVLEVRRTDLQTKLGEIFRDVPIPVDREHYDALLKWYKTKKDWVRHYHLKNKFPDLRQRDAATVHKSQGSTYDVVFIDVGNISSCNFVNQVARMLYVAVSRPRKRIVFYGKLSEKYGGLVR